MRTRFAIVSLLLLGACASNFGQEVPDAGGADGGGLDAQTAPHADFYVDAVHGDDTNGGTLDAPFRTVVRARDAVRAMVKTGPVIVMLRGGTYYEPNGVAFDQPGDDGLSDAARVTWEAFPGEVPVVSGGVRVTGWTHASGNVWTVQLDPTQVRYFENLFYDGERRLRPRLYSPTNNPATAGTPNLGSFLRVADEVDVAERSIACPQLSKDGVTYKCGDRFAYDPNDPIASSWANLAATNGNRCNAAAGNPNQQGDVEVMLFEAWTMEKMRVSCVDTTAHVVYFTAPTPVNPDGNNFRGPVRGHRYVVENVEDVFTSTHVPGTWFLDRSSPTSWTLSYAAKTGEDPNVAAVVIPQAQPIVTLAGTRFVTFQGITFEADDYVPAGVDNPNDLKSRHGPKQVIDGFNIDENGENWLPGAVDCASCRDTTFEAITVRHTSATGLQIASTDDTATGDAQSPAENVRVLDSFFYDLGDSGIHVGNVPEGGDQDGAVVQRVTVRNNLIQGYSRVFADGEGLAQGNGHDITYDHNDVTDGYHAAISVCNLGCPANDHDIVSSYNHVWNVIRGITSDGGTIYYNTGGGWGSASGNVIDHNLVHDVTDSVIIDRDVKGSGYGGEGLYLDVMTGDVDVRNNVVYRVSGAGLHITGGPKLGVPADRVTNNVFAYAMLSMAYINNPWPEGCPPPNPAYDTTRAKLTSNVWYFDRSYSHDNFMVVGGCQYACGLPFDRFLDFESNVYWRKDGGFADDANQFHALIDIPPGSDPSQCNGSAPPGNWMTFGKSSKSPRGDWQDSYLSPDGVSQPMSEDANGAIASPGFAGEPPVAAADFRLAKPPVAGFDPAATNDTIANAGRTDESVSIAPVPDTFPTYALEPSQF